IICTDRLGVEFNSFLSLFDGGVVVPVQIEHDHANNVRQLRNWVNVVRSRYFREAKLAPAHSCQKYGVNDVTLRLAWAHLYRLLQLSFSLGKVPFIKESQ